MNILMILPMGVTSKNIFTGARRILFSVIVCTPRPIALLYLSNIWSFKVFRANPITLTKASVVM